MDTKGSSMSAELSFLLSTSFIGALRDIGALEQRSHLQSFKSSAVSPLPSSRTPCS